jgi:hypothetical protein
MRIFKSMLAACAARAHVPSFAFAVACGLPLLVTLPAIAEDLTILQKATGRDSAGTWAKYLSATRTRSDHGHYTNITDMALGKGITIDHQKKEYYEATQQEEETANRLQQQKSEKKMAELEETMAKLKAKLKETYVPHQRRQSASLKKLPDHRTIAGYDCEHYVVTVTHWVDGKVALVTTHDDWVAPDLRDPSRAASDSYTAKIKALSSDLNDYYRVMDELADKGLVLASIVAPTTQTSNNPPINSTEATEVKRGPIDPSVFLAPTGYTKVESWAAKIIREDGLSGSK